MKQLNISLTDSFKLRNLIKRKIGLVNGDIATTPISYDPDEDGKKVDFIKQKYQSIDNMVETCLSLQETLGNLNMKIDEANIEVRPMLDTLESLNAQKGSLGMLLNQIQSQSKSVKKEFNSVTGVWDITELSQAYSEGFIQKINDRNKLITRRIHEIEEKISDMNGKVHFDFEIDEAVYDFIYDL